MGGFFGVVSKKKDAMLDVFLGTDYHSHLGTKSGGLAAYDKTLGLQITSKPLPNAFAGKTSIVVSFRFALM